MADGSHLIQFYSCQKKVRHSNRKKADAHIRKMAKSKKRASKNLVAYKCVHCKGYHVGNKKEVESEKD